MTRVGKLRGKFTLRCDRCGKKSPANIRVRDAIRLHWAYAMEGPFGNIGDDLCPTCAKREFFR